MKFRRLGFLFAAILLISSLACPVVYAENISGSIAVLGLLDNRPMDGVIFKAYQISDYDAESNQFDMRDVYRKYQIDLDMSNASSIARFSESLWNYIRRDGVLFDYRAASDKTGVAVFEQLSPGMYLIVSDAFTQDNYKYTASPMLVWLPNLDGSGRLVYAAEIEAKFVGFKLPDPEKPDETITRRVLKTWDDDNDSAGLRPREIWVDLLRDGIVYDTIKLNQKNSWRHVWPDLSPKYEWSVVEQDVPGEYRVDITRKGLTFVIENRYKPDEPSLPPPVITPTDPAVPPVTPVEPVVPGPGSGMPNIPIEPGRPVPELPGPKIPQTGQLWWPVIVFTIVGLLLVLAGTFLFIWKSGAKSRVGLIFVGFGAVLILVSLGLTVNNISEDRRVGEAMPDLDIQIVDFDLRSLDSPEAYIPDYILSDEFEMPEKQVLGHDYIGEIVIESQGLKLPVISDLTYGNLKTAPCRYVGSVYDCNFIIGAHNYDSHFGRLKNLNPGDAISFVDMDGNEFKYNVSAIETVPGSDKDRLAAGDWDMTLFTCAYGGRNRVVIRCNLVDNMDLAAIHEYLEV